MPKSDRFINEVIQQVQGVKRAGQVVETKSLHPFPARMPRVLAEHLIRGLSEEGDVVLDPMMGSGTTLIAAQLLGRQGIGVDIDHMSHLLARVSCSQFDKKQLELAGNRVLDRAHKLVSHSKGFRQELKDLLDPETIAFVDYWFPRRAQRELLALRVAIEKERSLAERDFCWVVFSSLIIAKSAGASYALDLAHSRPHRDLSKKIWWPLENWPVRFQRAIKNMSFTENEKNKLPPSTYLGDARQLFLPDNSVDLILTSPPYKQAIDYIRTHKFTLSWLGYTIETMRDIRSEMIGTECGLYGLDGIPDSIEQEVSDKVSKSRTQAKTRRYLSDLQAVLREMERVLKPGKVAVIVVGPSIISSNRHDAGDILSKLAEHAGLRTVSVTKRKINSARRSLPSPSTIAPGNNFRRRMRSEFLVALRK